ncbi:MAG TPA: V-type ATPase 116kDa subunit family protein [Bacteroidales bacterium]|nr:V-type ATPase 116kDa subunit family protein [Bacteroidales bacterium]
MVYHEDYERFLKGLRSVGVIDIVKRKKELDKDAAERLALQKQVAETIKLLKKHKKPEITAEAPSEGDGMKIFEHIRDLQAEVESLNQQLATLKKEIEYTEPWGDFDPQIIEKLRKAGLRISFYIIPSRKFDPQWLSKYNIGVVNEQPGVIYFILVNEGQEEIDLPAEEVKAPERPLSELLKKQEAIQTRLSEIEEEFARLAASSIPLLQKTLHQIASEVDYHVVVNNTLSEAEGKLKILEGFAPVETKETVEKYCEENGIFYIETQPDPNEKVPILLRNNSFAKLFEPIGHLYSLPKYGELDLTPFFAPFFMMFFGFCLGDAGYGLFIFIAATLFKKFKAKPSFKPYVTLAQYLSLATFIFGAISGTFFGISLIDADIPIVENIKSYFFDSNKMLVLSLILGAVQIVFGMCIKVVNITHQEGFRNALSLVGWLILILGLLIRQGLVSAGVLPKGETIVLYSILGVSCLLIFFLNDLKTNVFVRIGKGLWDVYGMATGIFGDLLSYIRLFALGISSSILGIVINNVAMSILGIPYIGPLLFVVFLVIAHLGNIAISSLGAFVHPMRLTFVEFYKNAGFKGGGKQYKPFAEKR